MGAIASQITSFTIVYSTVYSDADQRKHQSSASLAFVIGIHRGPMNSPHKWPVTRKMFPFDDVIMYIWVINNLFGHKVATYIRDLTVCLTNTQSGRPHIMCFCRLEPFYGYSLTLIPAWISKYMPGKVWDEITYAFPNFNWISDFIPCFMMDVITYPCCD